MSTGNLIAEAAIGLSITLLLFINSLPSNHPEAFSRLLDEFKTVSDVVVNESPLTVENASDQMADAGANASNGVEISFISAPDTFALLLDQGDIERRDNTFMKSTKVDVVPAVQRRVVRKMDASTSRNFDMHEARLKRRQDGVHSSRRMSLIDSR